MESQGLIFVGGCMRSGTTLLQKLLCAAPDTNPAIAECQYLRDQMSLYERWKSRFDLFLDEYFGTPGNFDLYTRSLVENLLIVTRARHHPTKTLVLKQPQMTPYFITLKEWFPDARFPVVVRDPRDTISSMLDVASKHRESGVNSDLVQMSGDMGKMSAYYKSHYVAVINKRAELDGAMQFVRYEDLVRTPERVLKEICEFCRIDVPSKSVDHEALEQQSLGKREDTQHDVYAGAFWSPLYKQGVSESQIGRHEKDLTDEQRAEIENHCSDFNQAFKYW